MAHATRLGLGQAWWAAVAVPAALVLLRWPILAGAALAAGGAWLRLVYAQMPVTSDQLVVGQAALNGVLAGLNPYGIGYSESVPPGSPFVYGPLNLLSAPLGVQGEILAATGTMLLLSWSRSFLTLAFFAAHYVVVQFSTSGINDLVPGFLILAGLLALERHRFLGGGLLALAAGVKPYALAWFPAAIGYGGLQAAAALAAVTAAVWSPLLVWGPGSFLRSVELAAATHPIPENSLNMPHLRVLAIPLAAASILLRRWWAVVLSGVAVFCIWLFLDRWASYGYWLVVLPLIGVVAERLLRRLIKEGLQAAVRAGADLSATTAAPTS